MSIKSEIVVCRASYRKVFSASFRRRSFSTATPVLDSYAAVVDFSDKVIVEEIDGYVVKTKSRATTCDSDAGYGGRERPS